MKNAFEIGYHEEKEWKNASQSPESWQAEVEEDAAEQIAWWQQEGRDPSLAEIQIAYHQGRLSAARGE